MKTGSSFSAGGRSRRIPSLSATPRALTSTSNRISTWSETKPTGTTTTSRTPRARKLGEMVAEIGACPRLGRATRGLVAPRPAVRHRARPFGDQAGGLAALAVVGVAVRENALREAVCAEDDVDALALLLGPAREPLGHARREGLDEARRVVIARDVLELDARRDRARGRPRSSAGSGRPRAR